MKTRDTFRLDLVGERFGRWTVIAKAEKGKRGEIYWECACDCGEKRIVRAALLRAGKSQSCGCFSKERRHAIALTANLRHGDCVGGKVSSEYRRWYAMKERCYNPKNKRYSEYGGRGIQVCDAWRNDFAAFLRDMGRCPPGRMLDREDSNGNYEPGNCRWVSSKTSNRNYATRNIYITRDGKTMCLKDWAKHLGIKYATLWKQYKEGRFSSS